MPVELRSLVSPATTAVLCMEMQRGVTGDLSPFPPLVETVRITGITPRIAELLRAARAAGAQVVYCNALHRADRKGSAINAPMLAHSAKHPGHMAEGTPSAENLPELAPRDGDFICSRYHGMAPFTGTSLDASLRNMGIRTVIATGVSLNVGIPGLCIEAVGLGYNVVVAADAVAGVPVEYGVSVLKHSLPALAYITSVAEIASQWQLLEPPAACPDPAPHGDKN